MDCNETRTLLLDRRRGILDPATSAALDDHLRTCAACRAEDAADAALSEALEKRRTRPSAPASLRRSIEARMETAVVAPRGRRITRTALAMAAGAAIALLVVFAWQMRRGPGPMAVEAINDHLRVLYRDRPVEVESGGIHQVKPWFEGRVDFAPVVPFGGDADFPLQGGSVAYFVDRKAAALVYKRRLHVITLLVFPAEGLPWSSAPTHPVGSTHGTAVTSRGFHVLLWREGDLGYALVSDVDPHDLDALAAKVQGGAPP